MCIRVRPDGRTDTLGTFAEKREVSEERDERSLATYCGG
jgi:hypothetical protein